MITIKTLQQRAALFQAIRGFFIGNGYLEVDTPVRNPAPAPEAQIEPEPAGGWFLQTSPEICMKRLLAAGAIKIFQICRCFRRNERGRRHLPEFTMLEWYRAGIDYSDLMTECEDLIKHVVKAVAADESIRVSGHAVSLNSTWERLKLEEAFQMFAPVTLHQALERDRFDETLVNHVEPRLGIKSPVFVYDYPASLGSLARLKSGEPDIAERFELYIGGIEVANGFSELTNVIEQRQRFEKERDVIKNLGGKPGPMPEKFLKELGRMPEAAGIAFGIDRLAMILFKASIIDDVVTFTPEDL
ncbi:MAG: EF-P lysine aminoacylase GenX [Desulfobulbaceae bacterium]|nr:EF-P lysine aminoacylase GenX [Desulfobulbaceae bacterium]